MNNLGLTSSQALERLKKYGLNQLPDRSRIRLFDLVFSQFKNFLTLILIVAVTLSFLIGDRTDGVLILVILILNISLGSWQEYKASKELQALRKLEVSSSRVIRDGLQIEIPSSMIVPEDIVLLEAGDKVPADGSLIECYDLSVNESALTGESLPVTKSSNPQDNLVYFGTVVTSGRANMQVHSTGINTKFGKIALTLSDIEEQPTPLEVALNSLAKKIGFLAIFISILMFILKVFQGETILEVFFSSIALMVAAVPEGLPAIITLLLAIGVHRMFQKKTVVRKMSAIETLGSVNVICTDKTGTLTKNEMNVKEVISHQDDLKELLRASVICNSASLVIKENHGSSDILGDTTEGALLLWAKEKGVEIEVLRQEGKILEEIAFDLKRRMMTVLWREKDQTAVYSKGAPEAILPLCRLGKDEIDKINHDYRRLASKGLRVLALASKSYLKKAPLETNLNFLALIGIADAPRLEAAQAILKAQKAGIRVVMVTGDNELTAKAIAEEVGLLKEGEEVLTGQQLDELTDQELLLQIDKIRIFARVIPEQKLRIVQIFQKSGKTVAVTGDGVNDSLALKQADVGIAMGKSGTEVAKEAADIVILDDDLSTLVSAIEQGRVVYSNIVKVVKFLMTGNLSEVLIIVVAAIVSLPVPLLPVQILWINFVTDGLPALSLAADPASKNVMHLPPRNQSETILSLYNLRFITFFGSLIAIFNIGLFAITLNFYDLSVARGVLFTSVVISQMLFVFLMRPHHSPTSNKYLLFSVGLIILAQVLIITVPFLRLIFKI